MAIGKGGGIGGRLYEDVKGLLVAVVICTAVLCLVVGPSKGIGVAGKGVDTLAVAAGATVQFISRAVPGIQKGQQLAGGSAGSAPAQKSAPSGGSKTQPAVKK